MSDALQEHVERVARNPNLSTYNEDQTKQSIILPLLRLLGWVTDDPFEVYPEYSAGPGRVDYALRIDGTNKVFIEVKRCDVDLEKHQEQLLRYSFEHGVPLAILTNGIVWWFYLPLREGVWEQRRFYTLDLNQRSSDDVAMRLRDFLSKECVGSGKSVENAETVITSRRRQKEVEKTLPRAWDDLLTGPDDALVEILREKVEQLCGFTPTDGEVHQFVRDHATKEERAPGVSSVHPHPKSDPATFNSRITSGGVEGQKERPTFQGGARSLGILAKGTDLSHSKPRTIVLEGRAVGVRNWSDASEKFVGWMLREGHLRRSHLPVSSYSGRDKYFINTHPQHQDPGRNGAWKEVDGVYVDIKFNAMGHVRNMLTTLETVSKPDLDVRIELV